MRVTRDIFSLFYSLWNNPNCKIFDVVQYLLKTSSSNSRTWAIHLRNISEMYGITDPPKCLESSPPNKNTYKEYVITKITAFHEREVRLLAQDNSAMKYLNVSLLGLRGRLHPAITGVTTTHEVKKMRPHVKMLTGNYLTFEIKSLQSGGSAECRICSQSEETPQMESLEHQILT